MFGCWFVLPPWHPGPSLGHQVMPERRGKLKAERPSWWGEKFAWSAASVPSPTFLPDCPLLVIPCWSSLNQHLSASDFLKSGILTSQVCISLICLVGITHHSGDVSYHRKSLIHTQILLLSFTFFHCLPQLINKICMRVLSSATLPWLVSKTHYKVIIWIFNFFPGHPISDGLLLICYWFSK